MFYFVPKELHSFNKMLRPCSLLDCSGILLAILLFSVSSAFGKDAVFEELNSFKYPSPDGYKESPYGTLVVSSLWLSERKVQSRLLASRSPLFLVHSFLPSVVPEGYFNRLMPFEAPYSRALPFQTAVSTNPVPGFPSKE